MRTNPVQDAIKAALNGDWNKALELNEKILKDTPEDIDTLNRLAKACSETGNMKKAKSLAKKVLDLDPFNPIATKCLQKWKVSSNVTKNGKAAPKDPGTFLEEPGKTKITNLLNLGSKKTIASLDTGDELSITAHKHKVSLITLDNEYVGKLADDIAARLRTFIKRGNEYKVLVKSSSPEYVRVFIRETKRSEALSDTPSFSSEKIDYVSFTPPELVHKKKPEVIHEEEQL